MIQGRNFSIDETLGVLWAVVGDKGAQVRSWGTLYVMLKKLDCIF